MGEMIVAMGVFLAFVVAAYGAGCYLSDVIAERIFGRYK